MIFGLPEDSGKDLNKTVFEQIRLKPAMELSRVGKKKTTRPVKVTLSSSSTAYQKLSQPRKLRQSQKSSSFFISPDRSLEDRVKHRLLVSNTSACPMCGDEEETVSHFLGQCPAIAQIRGQYFQDYYLSVNDIFDNQHISTIINFTNRTKRLIVPEELDQTGVTQRLL